MKKHVKSFIAGVALASMVAYQIPSVAESIEVAFNKIKVTINGQPVSADNVLINGRTYVPLRAISEILGKDVTFDQATSTAGINDKDYKQNTSSSTNETVAKLETKIPTEYKSALNKANSYAKTMYMSKKGIYDQLVSEYGEKFSVEAAQYAIDNVVADWNANALAKAKNYQDKMSMSPSAIHGQLISEHGEKFTDEEANYAIKHLND